MTLIDLASFFGERAFKRIAARRGYDAAVMWLHEPDTSFMREIARMMYPADRQEVRLRIMRGDVPDERRVLAFASYPTPDPLAGGMDL